MFSDIDLGQEEKTGVDVVRAFQTLQPSCAVVYLTSHLNFATEVYETPHVYFVLKGELRKRLPAVMDRVASRHRLPSRAPLYIKRKDSEIILDPDDVLYCEHQGRQTQIVTNGETVTVYQKIAELMDLLDPHAFVRCHTSYIVHLRYVTKFNRTAFTMSNGQTIPISRSNYADTKQRFSDYLSRVL
ncbi:MAG: LytTR family transcriptional regulator DNA-binding domain-containing protein [Butyricicoccus sp.]|nr:LytTR family transcriptional regulator DNA-binding domain-containing protein [Butyricicoccus sp.]